MLTHVRKLNKQKKTKKLANVFVFACDRSKSWKMLTMQLLWLIVAILGTIKHFTRCDYNASHLREYALNNLCSFFSGDKIGIFIRFVRSFVHFVRGRCDANNNATFEFG